MMHPYIRTWANAWAALLDFGVGAAIVALYYSGGTTSVWLLLVGGAAALAPDWIDVVWLTKVLLGKQISTDHHKATAWKTSHNPFFFENF